MQPSSPWISMCIYCTSVYALTSLALFAFIPQSCILKASPQRGFFFKQLLTAVDLFWLYSVPLSPWTSYYICLLNYSHFSAPVLRMLCMLLNAGYGHTRVSMCINVWDLSLRNPTFFLVSMMHQQSATPHYTSAQVGGQHYQGQQAMGMMGQGGQGSTMISQRPMGSYRSSQQGRW